MISLARKLPETGRILIRYQCDELHCESREAAYEGSLPRGWKKVGEKVRCRECGKAKGRRTNQGGANG